MVKVEEQIQPNAIGRLKQAAQGLYDGIDPMIERLSAEGIHPRQLEEFNSCKAFISQIISWFGKMPESRLRDILLSAVQQVDPLIQYCVKNNLGGDNSSEDPVISSRPGFLRNLMIELGPHIKISQDNMAVMITVPSEISHLWTPEDLIESLQRVGVCYGIDETAIQELFENKRFDCPQCVARGKFPTAGNHAEFDDCLKLLGENRFPFRTMGSRVDFKDLNLFKPVKAGQVVLRKIPATPGEAGVDVKGNEIASVPGMDIDLPPVKNCELSEDRTELRSLVDGCAYIENEKLVVVPSLVVHGNVDLATGHIQSDVSVTVHGDVLSDFRLDTKEDLAVEGAIDGAFVRCKGSIFCKGGINGKEKAVLQVGKHLETIHINHSTVRAGGYVTVQGPIVQSDIAAKRIYSLGTEGQIMGGRLSAWEDICASVIGSDIGVKTEIELGGELPLLQETVDKLTGALKEKKQQKARSAIVLDSLKKKAEQQENPGSERAQMKKIELAMKKLDEDMAVIQEKLEKAIKELSYSETCVRMVRAQQSIYPGTRIKIEGKTLVVKNILGPTTVMVSDGKLITLPYQERDFEREANTAAP